MTQPLLWTAAPQAGPQAAMGRGKGEACEMRAGVRVPEAFCSLQVSTPAQPWAACNSTWLTLASAADRHPACRGRALLLSLVAPALGQVIHTWATRMPERSEAEGLVREDILEEGTSDGSENVDMHTC